VPGTEVIKYLLGNGVMATLNQTIDFDTAALAADHFGFEAENADTAAQASNDGQPLRRRHPLLDLSQTDPKNLITRPPIVTVLGHVDHGKTSLLDKIRATKVAAGEAGGITQKIGAYQVERGGRKITFVDTPGHEAFTEMRARGADVTDVAILVVAADDGIMPQTEEAIQHAKSAGVPIVVALNKIDKDGSNPDRVLQQLAERELIPSEYGGETTVVRTSAKSGQGIDELLEMVLLTSDTEVEPKANPKAETAVGTVLEADRESGRGPIATVLVQNGTLRVGDVVVAGKVYGRIKSLTTDEGKRVKEAGPSQPVVVAGLNDVALAGDVLQVMDTERAARALAEQRAVAERKQLAQPIRRVTLADLATGAALDGQTKSLNLVLKAEAAGSLEALRGQIQKIEDDAVTIKVVGHGVGAVNESDVNLAAVTDGIVIGFNVQPDDRAKAAAETQGVDIRYYDVIYQITDDIDKAIKGLYEPTFREVLSGKAEVRKIFTVDGKNAIAGSNVVDGKIVRNSIGRVLRGNKEIHKDKIIALKRFKDDVREVAKGYDCGITIEGFSEFEEGDVIEAYTVEQQNL
jgi:translation initiation factor IF-2